MAKRGQISVYEVQKTTKPAIEETCAALLTDPGLHEGMATLLALSKDIRMKPVWSHTNHWNCNYKGNRVISYTVGDGDKMKQNCLKIKVDISDRDSLNGFLMALPDELLDECVSGMKCYGCGGCKPGRQYTVLGKQIYLCRRLSYQRVNPSPAQFRLIAELITARRQWIKNAETS
jgi:hypothetical protein